MVKGIKKSCGTHTRDHSESLSAFEVCSDFAVCAEKSGPTSLYLQTACGSSADGDNFPKRETSTLEDKELLSATTSEKRITFYGSAFEPKGTVVRTNKVNLGKLGELRGLYRPAVSGNSSVLKKHSTRLSDVTVRKMQVKKSLCNQYPRNLDLPGLKIAVSMFRTALYSRALRGCSECPKGGQSLVVLTEQFPLSGRCRQREVVEWTPLRTDRVHRISPTTGKGELDEA